jgi:hypothetical protein
MKRPPPPTHVPNTLVGLRSSVDLEYFAARVTPSAEAVKVEVSLMRDVEKNGSKILAQPVASASAVIPKDLTIRRIPERKIAEMICLLCGEINEWVDAATTLHKDLGVEVSLGQIESEHGRDRTISD